MTYEEWWREVGSGMPPMPGEDAHEHVQRVTAACWPAARAAIYEAEAAQLTAPTRIDAARYRLLRRGQHWSVVDGIGEHLRADLLDAAIDAALPPNV